MKDISLFIEKNLLYASAKGWMEETNSFHMPMGKMTFTLQNVCCLFALLVKVDARKVDAES
jgi:hypothetical protein